jgi:hypothetical protein
MSVGQCEGCKNLTLLIDGVVCETCDEIYADTPSDLE